MTAKRGTKSRKMRGVRQHGYGKTHRGAGHRGGRGNAGTGKKADQKKPNIWAKKYFGKTGFVRVRIKKPENTINLNTVQDKLEIFIKKGFAKKEKESIVVNLKQAGYTKLLGTGKIKQKMNIIVTSASKKTVEKIKKAEGQLTLG